MRLITRDSKMIMCVCVCVCLSVYVCHDVCPDDFNHEGLVPHQQYFAGTLLGMFSCESYVSRTHDVIDDAIRSQSKSNFEIYIYLRQYLS